MENKKLLIIEDEEDLNNMIVHHLEGEDFEVDSAFNGDEALAILESDNFDLIILDILLPGIDPWEVCKQIRMNKETKSTPVVFLSALSSEADRIKGFDLGADDYLIKPFSPRELVSRVKAILWRQGKQSSERTSVAVGNLAIGQKFHLCP